MGNAGGIVSRCRRYQFAITGGIKRGKYSTWNLRNSYVPVDQPFSHVDVPEHLFPTFGNIVWNKLFRRSFIVESNLFFQEISRANDLFFSCASIALADRICTLEESYVHYRIANESSLQATNDRDPLSFLNALQALHAFLKERTLIDSVYESYIELLLDAISYNADALHTLDGLKQLKDAVISTVEPRFKLLQTANKLIRNLPYYPQYQNLIELDMGNYLLSRKAAIMEEREDLYWINDWTDWLLWKTNRNLDELSERYEALSGQYQSSQDKVNQLELEIKMLKSDITKIEQSHSYRLGKTLCSPLRYLKNRFTL